MKQAWQQIGYKEDLTTFMVIESESEIDYLLLARKLEKTVRDAGQAILDIYHQGSDFQTKDDGSPVTKADFRGDFIARNISCRTIHSNCF